LQKNRQKTQNRFFLGFGLYKHHVFGVSRSGAFKNTTKKTTKNEQPGYFFGVRGTNQPRQKARRFVF
jgi:hypothetical protein